LTDVRLFQTPDDGEIEVLNGQFTLSDGLETGVYLSLFGGNEQDSGLPGDDSKQFWGNVTEPELSRRYRSETQFLLRSIPATTGNLRRIEDAIGRDLAWMLEQGVATFVGASLRIPALNTVAITVNVEVDGRVFALLFTQSWQPQ
jgi:phage gp46-like protein